MSNTDGDHLHCHVMFLILECVSKMSTRRRGRHVNTALAHWETEERKNNDTDNKTENRQTDSERNKGGIKGSPKGKMLTFYILYLFSDQSCLKTIASMFIQIIIIYFFVRRFLKEYFFVNAYKSAFIRLYFVKKKLALMYLSPCCFSRLLFRCTCVNSHKWDA